MTQWNESYCSSEFRLTGPRVRAHVTVSERFLLTRLRFLFAGRDAPRWHSWIHRLLEFLGPWFWDGYIERFLRGPIDWWIRRENERVLGDVRVCAVKIGTEHQMSEGVGIPALALDGMPVLRVGAAEPGTTISVELEGTSPEALAVLFCGLKPSERVH